MPAAVPWPVGPPDPPPVTVVDDPLDEVGHLRAALAAHDPAAGRVVLHPAPAPGDAAVLAGDLLDALHVPAPPLEAEAGEVWALAAAWATGRGITELVVLRGHVLLPTVWSHLLDLREATGVQLTVVCHRAAWPARFRRALAGVPYRRVPADRWHPPPARPRRRRPVRDTGWITLEHLAGLVTWDEVSSACDCTGPRPAPHPRRARPLPERRLHRHLAARVGAVTHHPGWAGALAAALATTAIDAEPAAATTTGLAPDAAVLTAHHPWYRCRSHPVAAWARPFLVAARAWRRTVPGSRGAGPDRPAALFPDSVTSRLTPLVEAARVRPPQPAARGGRVEWPESPVCPW